jgi:hypothetical protein
LMECVGLCVIFMIANVGLCVGIVFLIRGLTSTFVSPYIASDLTLVTVSALQGFVFRLWWRSA